jgi:hypothetical protein
MTVVVRTPVRPRTQEIEETICVENCGLGRPSAQVVTRIELTSNQEFLGAVLGGQRRFLYASRDKLCVVSHPANDYRHESYNGAAYEVATVSLGIQAIHQAFAAAKCRA